MTLADIASDISMHTSTISRGIKNKYLQYPFGVVICKEFYSHLLLEKRITTAQLP